MKLKPEIELWYNFNVNAIRIINKNKPHGKQLFYDKYLMKWFKSQLKNKEVKTLIALDWKKIGEL